MLLFLRAGLYTLGTWTLKILLGLLPGLLVVAEGPLPALGPGLEIANYVAKIPQEVLLALPLVRWVLAAMVRLLGR